MNQRGLGDPGHDEPVRGLALGACGQRLADVYDAALLDLDGVLYLGEEPIEHAAKAVAGARDAGMRAAFVTNNASRRPAAVAAHLTALGIPAEPADVVTSAQAAARMLHDRLGEGDEVLVVGTQALADEMTAVGLTPVRMAGARVRAVVQGYDPDTGWHQLAEACVALRAGAVWVATNTDATLPSRRGPLPGNGAMVAALRQATGLEPLVAGKPEPVLHRESVTRVGAERPLVIGDRLDTDVLGAVRGGSDSLLVLTGVVDLPALLAAPAGQRPTFVARDLRGLLAPQPAVRLEERRASCGDAAASYDGGSLRVTGAGDDALRAACALAWQCADRGLQVRELVGLEQ